MKKEKSIYDKIKEPKQPSSSKKKDIAKKMGLKQKIVRDSKSGGYMTMLGK